MASLWSGDVEYKKDEKTRYEELNNIKDVTQVDLKNLKAELKLNQETDLDAKLKTINDKDKLAALSSYVVKQSWYEHDVDLIKDVEIQTVLKDYKFELLDLWDQVKESTAGTSTSGNGNVLLNDNTVWSTKEKKETDQKDEYIDPYKSWSYAETNKNMD